MEIADLNLISDFEAGIKCLQNNPSFISKLKPPQLYSFTFWTYGALIIAVFATFGNLFNRLKKLIHQTSIQFWVLYRNSKYPPTVDHDDLDFDFSDDEDSPESDDDDLNLSGSLDSVGSEDGYDANEVFRYAENDDEGQNGNFTFRRRNGFSWSDFAAGKSVVQLWDSFGLGFDLDDDEDEVSIWDLNQEVKISSGQRCTAAVAADTVVLTAEVNGGNGEVGFGTYDSRVDETSPAIYAAWRPRRRVGSE
ncbi:uncharacterized protein LOC143619126 [Bidens hawaiensis]|uniref:uncharacterized protein LOC143619126 n=1 Tax=Bidens hawaiensis TaxID=980011 RepID=UPI0040496E6D